MNANLSAETVAELVETLRYLKSEFDLGFRIDAINMRHVDKALARVDIENSFARQAARDAEKAEAPALQIAAE